MGTRRRSRWLEGAMTVDNLVGYVCCVVAGFVLALMVTGQV